MRNFALFLFASISLLFGQSATPIAPAETVKKASLEGVVTNGVTQEPLRRANVVLYRTGKNGTNMGPDNVAYSAVTDTAGKFRIENIEPGEYVLNYQKVNFIESQNTIGNSTRQLKLGAGESVTSLHYALLPQAVVTGRVVDDEGEPVQGVSVMLVRLRYLHGSQKPMPDVNALTNDLGEYRIVNVQPGRYYIQATIQRVVAGGAQFPAPTPGAGRSAFVSTFCPSAAEMEQASRIELRAGQQLSGQDIALRRDKVVSVSGKVLDTDGSPAKRTFVMFAVGDSFMNDTSMGAASDDKGNFTAQNVRPGKYTLIANGMDGQNRKFIQSEINVGEVDLANVTLQMESGVEAKGSLVLEGSEKQDFDFSGFFVNLSSVKSTFFGGAGAQVKADGAFTLTSIMPGRYLLNVYGASNGYVKSIQAGGEEILGKEVEASSLAQGLRVAVRLDSASVKGTVEIPEDRRASLSSAVALLVPVDTSERNSTQIKWRSIYQNLGFELKNVRPGEYLVFAFEEFNYFTWDDVGLFAAIENKGTKVSLSANESKTLTLKLLPWPQQFSDNPE